MNHTERLAAYAAGFSYDQLPAEAIDAAKLILLDTIGAILLGAGPEYAASWLTGDLARVLGGRAAWLNAEREDARAYVIGMAAHRGVLAALLAQAGMGAPIGILDDGKPLRAPEASASTTPSRGRCTSRRSRRSWARCSGSRGTSGSSATRAAATSTPGSTRSSRS